MNQRFSFFVTSYADYIGSFSPSMYSLNKLLFTILNPLKPEHSIAANSFWISPAQSFLVSSSVGTHDQIFVGFKTIYLFGNGACSSTRGVVGTSRDITSALQRPTGKQSLFSVRTIRNTKIQSVGGKRLCHVKASGVHINSWALKV
jgi:hypothetical protein